MFRNFAHIIFFGTHNFAATILEGLLKSPFVSVELVITMPDRPVGREQKLQPSPVKILAQKHNIPIDQPQNLKTYQLPATSYKLFVVAQYSTLIPDTLLNVPKYGTLNVHTSLLPKYRGASPIQSALINGEKKTGITIMKMDKGMDTGPILLQKTLKISPDDTYAILDTKLAKIGLQALLEAIPAYIQGEIKPKPQNNSKATVCKQLTREDGKIDWNKSAQEIYNLYRGLTPWPGVWTIWNEKPRKKAEPSRGKRLKLLKIQPASKKMKPGQVAVENDKIFIGCGNSKKLTCPAKPEGRSGIEVLELQLEGKKAMTAKEFLNGYKDIKDAILK